MAKSVKLSLQEPFLSKALSGQIQQIMTDKKLEEKDTVALSDTVSAIVTEVLSVTISRAAVTISTGKEGEAPYDLSNRDTFAKASGYESFEDLKNQLEEEKQELPAEFTLIRWNASALLDESGTPKQKAASTPKKTAAQKAKEQEEAARTAEIDKQIEDIDAEITEGKKALEAENDPLLKKIIEDDLAKLEAEKADLVKSKGTGA